MADMYLDDDFYDDPDMVRYGGGRMIRVAGDEEKEKKKKEYFLNLGPRADELDPEEIAYIAKKQGWKLPVKYKVYGIPHSLRRDPIRNVKAMAIGRWLAARKLKAKKTKTEDKPTKTSKKKTTKKTTTKGKKTSRKTSKPKTKKTK